LDHSKIVICCKKVLLLIELIINFKNVKANSTSVYTGQNSALVYTGQNSASVYTGQNSASVYTGKNSASVYTGTKVNKCPRPWSNGFIS